MNGNRAMSSDLAGCNVFAAIAEDVACDEVDPAEDEDDAARSDDDAPEWHSQRLLAGGLLVEIAEHVDAEDAHGESERDEAVSGTQKWPVASVEGAEE